MTFDPTTVTPHRESLASLVGRTGAVSAIVLALIWAPFPLGSAVTWGAPVLELVIAVAWLFWILWVSSNPSLTRAVMRSIWPAAILCPAVLLWMFVQTIPFIPSDLKHPVWQMAADALHHTVPGVISVNPWRTETELLKLSAETAVFVIVFSLSSRAKTAKLLLNAIILTSAMYAIYALVLAILGMTQASLIFGIPGDSRFLSGPFMLHNSFATYVGLGLVASIVSLIDAGKPSLSTATRRYLLLNLIQFIFGRGAWRMLASLILFSSLIASASRGGFVSTMIALMALAGLALWRSVRARTGNWILLTLMVATVSLALILAANADLLSDRLAQLSDGSELAARSIFWAAAMRMIEVFPWTGLGLGTFEDSYPMFAQKMLPFVIDKAHCDYLEFAAGVGLPAALCWWVGVIWLALLNLQGCIRRRRGAFFCFAGFGAAILVAAHSTVDFSLQLPAVALVFSVLLGVGGGQSRRIELPPNS
jgi:O-antigen ligase